MFCNINFNITNRNALFLHSDKNRTKLIIPVNAKLIVDANTSKRFFELLNNNYVTFDGQIPYLIAKLFNRKYKDVIKLAGSDIVFDFSGLAQKNGYKIFFLGGKEKSNKLAVSNIKEQYNILIEGYSPAFEDYPFSDKFNLSCMEKIADFSPEILFVGFGAPKQEYWLSDHIETLYKIGVKYAIGCGGTFDFLSQEIKRAPVFIQKMGLEGLYRLYQEPNKIRYKRLINSLKFIKYIWRRPFFE